MNNENVLLKYLDKNYIVKDSRFFTRYGETHEWGVKIVEGLSVIFNFDEEFCELVFRLWAFRLGLTNDEIILAWNKQRLKAHWRPELAQDLQSWFSCDAEADMISMLANEISREIDNETLKELSKKTKKIDELIGVIKCCGYELTPLTHNEQTFTPIKYFVSTNYNDMINERQNNTFWQDWINKHPS